MIEKKLELIKPLVKQFGLYDPNTLQLYRLAESPLVSIEDLKYRIEIIKEMYSLSIEWKESAYYEQ